MTKDEDSLNTSNSNIRAKESFRPPKNFKEILFRACTKCKVIVASKHFDSAVTLSILFSGVLVGAETYSDHGLKLLVTIAYALMYAFFAIEMAMKFFAKGMTPLALFAGPDKWWNGFDIVLGIVLLIPMNSFRVPSMRILLLVRIAKLSHKLPLVHMIMVGLIGGLQSVAYIVAFLFLVLYFFSIIGVCIFKQNDPWGFRDLSTSLITLFHSATLDDWTEVMYVNIFGCDLFTIDGLYSSDLVALQNKGRPLNMFFCSEPYAQPIVTAIFWLTFIATCSFVVLSLFIGAVTMSMSESMAKMKEEVEERQREKRRERAQKDAEQLQRSKEREAMDHRKFLLQAQTANSFGSIGNLLLSNIRAKREAEKLVQPVILSKEQRHIKMLLEQAWSGGELALPTASKERKSIFRRIFEAELDDDEYVDNIWKSRYIRLSRACTRFDEREWVGSVMMIATVLSGIIIGIGTYEELNYRPITFTINIINWGVTFVFVAEVLIKICAEELRPWVYFKTSSNVLDFITATGAFAVGSSDIFVILRLLRLLRLMELLKSLPQLQVITQSVVMSLSSISYVSLVLVMFFYFFAIIGMLLFEHNDPFHFGVLHLAMLSLFRCATLDDWSSIMYTNMFGCDMYGYDDRPELCTNPEAHSVMSVFYFVIVIILGAFVLLTLFIGVVTNSIEEASKDMETKIQVEQNVGSVRLRYTIDDEILRAYRRIFAYLDLDGSGTVGTEELSIGLEMIGQRPTQEDLTALYNTVDRNCSGEVDFAEFLEFMMRLKSCTVIAMQKKLDHYYSDMDSPEPFESLGGAAANLVKKSHLGMQHSAEKSTRKLSLRHQVYRAMSKLKYDKDFREKIFPAENANSNNVNDNPKSEPIRIQKGRSWLSFQEKIYPSQSDNSSELRRENNCANIGEDSPSMQESGERLPFLKECLGVIEDNKPMLPMKDFDHIE